MSDSPPPEDAAPSPEPAATSDGEGPSKDERNLAVLAHMLGIPVPILGALLIWMLKKETSPYLDHQGKEALNFQLTVWPALIITGFIPLLGCVTVPVLLVLDIVFCILAAVACSRGERYRYPLALRLVS